MTENAAPLVRRGRRNAHYTAISNALIDHPTLSPEARLVLIYLLSKPDDWQLQINDIRRLLGTAGKPCGRNKAYEVIKKLKASAYVVAVHELAENGRFDRIAYYVFDEPHPDPERFIAEHRGGPVGERSGAAREVDRTPVSPRTGNRDTEASPRPEIRDPGKRDLTKDGKKQTTEIPPPSPEAAACRAAPDGGRGDLEFSEFWNDWPHADRPRERDLAEKLFLRLSPADRKAAVRCADRHRSASAHRGVVARMIPYLRHREFAEFEGGPEFTADGFFMIKAATPEWAAWAGHLRGSVSPAIWAKQEAVGYLLCRTRWPAQADYQGQVRQANAQGAAPSVAIKLSASQRVWRGQESVGSPALARGAQ